MIASKTWFNRCNFYLRHDSLDEDICVFWVKLQDDLFLYVLANGQFGFKTNKHFEQLFNNDPYWELL
jgi:hypothetical protein